MLGVLLESRSRRPRRTGGVALSIAAHLAIIGVATAATTASPREVKPLEPRTVVIYTPKPEPTPATPRRVVPDAPAPGGSLPTLSPIAAVYIDAPTVVPVELPEITLSRGPAADSLIIGSIGGRSGRPGGGFGLVADDDSPSSGEWRGNELLMRMTASGKPRYPDMLRQSGVDGRVLIRFTVDTLGRIDPASVAVLSTTHELFTQSVRAALPAFRFRPAESGGRRVPALAEMPFEFTLRR